MRLFSKRMVAGVAVGAVALLVAAGGALAGGGHLPFGLFGAPAGNQTALLNDVASRLNVTPANLRKAIKDASKAQIDQAVKNGALSNAQALALKERIDAGSVAVSVGRPAPVGLQELGVIEASAEYLDMTVAQLREALADGDSLADVAEDKNKSVSGLQQAIVAAAGSQLAAAVAAGDLTDARRDAILADLEDEVDTLVERNGLRAGLAVRKGRGHDLFVPFGGRLGRR
jgi:hypothetical protein